MRSAQRARTGQRCLAISTHLDPVLELNLSTGIDTDVLESLARTVVRLSAVLQRVEDAGLVDPSRRVCGYRTALSLTPINAG